MGRVAFIEKVAQRYVNITLRYKNIRYASNRPGGVK